MSAADPPRGRGRPRKHPLPDPDAPKRGRGRPPGGGGGGESAGKRKGSDEPQHAVPIPSLDWRRREWAPYPFAGSEADKKRKIDFLAHLEGMFVDTEACRAAGVLRYEYELWHDADEVFRGCAAKAIDVCVRRIECVMYHAALTLDEKGKVQLTAAFGILNTYTANWGLLKAQLLARLNTKVHDATSRLLCDKVPADVLDEVRAGLAAIIDEALSKPLGSTLKRR